MARVNVSTSIDLGGTSIDADFLIDQLAEARARIVGPASVSFSFSSGGGDPRERDNVTLSVR